EFGPVQLALDTVAFHGEVEEPVGELVSTNLGPLLDVLDDAAVVGELDQSVLQERVMKAHSHSPVEATVSRNRFAVVTGGAPRRAPHHPHPPPQTTHTERGSM